MRVGFAFNEILSLCETDEVSSFGCEYEIYRNSSLKIIEILVIFIDIIIDYQFKSKVLKIAD